MVVSWGLLILLPVAAVFMALPIAALWLVLRHRRADARDGGQCGKCGYAVRGVASLNCPECGADLREVGIVTSQHGGAFMAAGAMWLVFVAVVGFVLFLVGARAAASATSYWYRRVIFVQAAPNWFVTLEAELRTGNEARLNVTGGNPADAMRIDLAAQECTFGPAGGAPRPFDAATLFDWLNTDGPKSRNAEAAADAADVIASVNEMATNHSASFRNGTHVTAHPVNISGSTPPSRRVLAVIVLVIVCTAAIGLAGLQWARMRMRPARWQFVTLASLWGGLIVIVLLLGMIGFVA